ncbi:hypothetical protein B0O99DRAFT_628684 [Bisporella sp. PMI_857]|nr:hypothetical protein B0O99DRAFT_628684 [Bisporella sp. PMI_857]
MPLFALPLADTSNATNSRLKYSSISREKSSQAESPQQSEEDDQSDNDELFSLPASTNPLSLTPAEIAQYKLAGLSIDEDIPRVKDFPHRGLPIRTAENAAKPSQKGKEKASTDADLNADDEEDEKRIYNKKGPALRLQHLGVLTAILQRCLKEGDIPRATRAFAMLIRMQFGGHATDIRSSGYWAIGAELLVRSMDHRKEEELVAENEQGNINIGDDATQKRRRTRWGTKEGLEKAKEYYEWLILQYPYKRQWNNSVTAIDFWPAMLSCEIYGIQQDHAEGMEKIEEAEELLANDDEPITESSNEDEEEDEEDAANDGGFTASQRRKARRRRRKEEDFWQQREDVRVIALQASEELAARMDVMMNPLPYSDSHILLRLRGMVALYIGDLSVPAPPLELEEEDSDDGPSLNLRSRHGEDTERRLLHRQRQIDHEQGRKRQDEERSRAKELFTKIRDDGGFVGGTISTLFAGDDEESHDSAQDDAF